MTVTANELDALTEMINIGIGRGANVLNAMLDSHIQLSVPEVRLLSLTELHEEMKVHGSCRLSAVNLSFSGNIKGNAELIFPSESASNLVAVFTGEEVESVDLDSIRAGALCEIGNVVLNAVMGSVSNLLKLRFNYTVPNYLEGTFDTLLPEYDASTDSSILLVRTRFLIQELEIQGDIVLFLKVGSFEQLLMAIDVVDDMEW